MQVGLMNSEQAAARAASFGDQPGQGQLVGHADEDHSLSEESRVDEGEAHSGVDSLGGLEARGKIFTDHDIQAVGYLCHAADATARPPDSSIRLR